MSVAIHYTSVRPPVAGQREVFGLQVAVADWLKAYFRYGTAAVFPFLIGVAEEEEELREIAQQAGLDPARLAMLDRRFPERNFAGLTTVFRLEPDTRNLLWQRQRWGAFGFCGLAHAISGTEAGEVLQDYCLSPSESTDAIVCPSQAVRSAIRAFWDDYGDFLRARFGANYRCPVELPVIPLGINCDKFAAKVTPDKRNSQRRALGIGADDSVLLWVGRLSAAIKAHPLAMFRAAELAAEKTGAKVHLVMVGYFVPDAAAAQFRDLAGDVCRAARVHFIAADDRRFADGLWAAADIFLSLIDNCQESFGLTPIEAMAAGLPRVISDWNGYRDSVTDGEDGFLIRTAQPPADMGFDLTADVLAGREIYGGFLAKAALTVAVDAEQAAERIALLIADRNLRAAMADRARIRARAVYDWRHIIPAYEALWAELAARRVASAPPVLTSALPTLPDPYRMYRSYPAACLRADDRITLAADFAHIKMLWRHSLNMYAGDAMIAAGELPALLGWLAEAGEVTLAGVLARFPNLDPPRLWRTMAWLQKLGIVRNSAC